MRKTKIVCTIGPASESPEIIKAMLLAGMNVARLNFSHGSRDEHGKRIDAIRKAASETGMPVAILLDTKGPEIRLGTFAGGSAQLEAGQKFTLTTREVEGNSEIVSVTHAGLPGDITPGHPILLDDGLIELAVEEVTETDVICRVINGGTVGDRKGINLPGTVVSLPAMGLRDREDIIFGVQKGVDFIAASFIRSAGDVLAIRRLLEEHDSKIDIIAKIENKQGLDNLDSILKVVDGLMVARGDLGVEIPPEEVPLAQKHMIAQCIKLGKPVITATQMLDSMIRNPRPTRAEASDVANAIFDGTDAIMLSGETAAGQYPVESVVTMARLAERTELAVDWDLFSARQQAASQSVTEAISNACRQTAVRLGAAAILAYSLISYYKLSQHMADAVLWQGNVYQSVRVRSPFILGFIRPKIYIPFGLDEDTRCHVLAHEGCHLKRRDHLTKLFAFLLLAVHWFNPLCWLAFALMSRDMEMSCDEKVLAQAGNIRKQYSASLLSFAANRRLPLPSPLAFGETGVKGRIQNVLKWKKPKAWITVGATGLAFLVLAACAVNPPASNEIQPRVYVSTECVFMNPLSSYMSFGDSGFEYRVGENSFSIVKKNSEEPVFEKQPLSWDWQALTDEQFTEWLCGWTSAVNYISPYENKLFLDLSEDWILLNMDGELWVMGMKTNPQMGRYNWDIYRLAPK